VEAEGEVKLVNSIKEESEEIGMAEEIETESVEMTLDVTKSVEDEWDEVEMIG
jgi:hypothetical protein